MRVELTHKGFRTIERIHTIIKKRIFIIVCIGLVVLYLNFKCRGHLNVMLRFMDSPMTSWIR